MSHGSSATNRQESVDRPTIAIAGLVVAAVAVFGILPVRDGEDVGFALLVGPLLLLSAAALWRFGTVALVWSVILGVLLMLMFGAYGIAGVLDNGDVPVFLLDLLAFVGGLLTVVGSALALKHRRRPRAPD